MQGRKYHLESINFVKIVCGLLIIYSGEYIRRYYLGINQDDKPSIDRFNESTGFNLVFFSATAFDVLFFVSGAASTMSLISVIREKTIAKGSEFGILDCLSLYTKCGKKNIKVRSDGVSS